MGQTYSLDQIARLPMPGDNTAIATRRLEAGDTLLVDGAPRELACTILEGHRFAIHALAVGDALLSWRLPFGYATHAIAPGEYVCNERTLASLRKRNIEAVLPAQANFVDPIPSYVLDTTALQLSAQLPLYTTPRAFQGFRRSPARGVGTRNFIVLLGTTSWTGGFVRTLEQRLAPLAAGVPNLDGIVAIAHTEGAVLDASNAEYVLRTLAGFMVHANVGAVIAVDYGWEPISNAILRRFMHDHAYPLADVPHHFLSLTGNFETGLAQAEAIVRDWIVPVSSTPRTEEGLQHLKVALQCGGSDAFSGVSANPLIGWLGREAVRYGGYANLTETPELIGAEPYVLNKVKDGATAQRFMDIQARFKAYAAAHGTSAEGNPSDGNKFRGLYNITLKSIGAAMKKHPDVRLDAAIEYGERMAAPGFYFMDSPGLDLESVAGQVASGCTVIFFTTGNGSVTNFPFVPTIKVVTTTARYALLREDMDVNAGAYLDGTPMDKLGHQLLELTVNVASGLRTAGERTGQAQVQIWRNWSQTRPGQVESMLQRPPFDGRPLAIQPIERPLSAHFDAVHTPYGLALAQVGLIVPTSLCAAQVAHMAADRLNRKEAGRTQGIARFVSLSHTEGCAGPTEHISTPVLLGYATHPSVRHCLLLEHGCEVTHNDYMQRKLVAAGLDPAHFGWASVQLDGGIARVLDKIEAWFLNALAADAVLPVETIGLEGLRLGLLAASPLPDDAAHAFSRLVRSVVQAGGTVVAASDDHLLQAREFAEHTLMTPPYAPTLGYGQHAATPGFHVMECQSTNPVEILTGLGASGVEIVVAYVGRVPVQGHPLMPVLQVTAAGDQEAGAAADLDLVLAGDAQGWADAILDRIAAVAARRYTPRRLDQGNIDFQIARGVVGISL